MRFIKFTILSLFIMCVRFLIAQDDIRKFKTDTLQQNPIFKTDQIEKSAFRSVRDLMMASPNTFYLKYNRMVVDGTAQLRNTVFIDGMEVDEGMNFPVRSMGQFGHYRFGQPVQYGLQLGSVVVIKSKDPKDKFSIFADGSFATGKGYQDHRLELGLGGPIRFSKSDEPGWTPRFYIGGSYNATNDPFPSWEEKQVLTDKALANMKQNPLLPNMVGGTDLSTSFIHSDDVEAVHAHPGVDQNSLNYIAKLTFPLVKGMELTVGRYQQIQEGRQFVFSGILMNSAYHPETKINNSDQYIRLDHNLELSEDISITYHLQFEYAHHRFSRLDEKHQDRWFEYGYLGKFQTYKMGTYELGSIEIDGQYYENVWLQNSQDFDTAITFTPKGFNPLLERYAEQVYELFPDKGDLNAPMGYWRNATDLILAGGLLNGMSPDPAYSKAPWLNPGTLAASDYADWNAGYSGYGFVQNNKYRGSGYVDLHIKRHTMTLGFEYKKEEISHYGINPQYLWPLMRQYTNNHIRDLDLSNPLPVYQNGIFRDTIKFYRYYDADLQQTFDKNLRAKLGLSLQGLDYILLDSYDMVNGTIDYYDRDGVMQTLSVPAQLLEFSMFNPLALAANNIVSYKGYDVDGNLLKDQPGVYDFFTYGISGAYQPKTFSAYVSDHFSWNSLELSVGLRMDRFDASQPVYIDPFSLYPILTKGEVDAIQGMPVSQPGNVPSDARVYVDHALNPTHIMGYRDGDVWFNESGNVIDNPESLDAGQGISPYLKYPGISVETSAWKPEMTFEMYHPEIYLLPQLSLTYSHRLGFAYFNYNAFSQNPNPTISTYRPEEVYFWQFGLNSWYQNPGLKPTRSDKMNVGIRPKIVGQLYVDVNYQIISYKNYAYPKLFAGAYPRDYTAFDNLEDRIGLDAYSLGLIYAGTEQKGLSGSVMVTMNKAGDPDKYYLDIADLVMNTNLLYRFTTKSDFKNDIISMIVSDLSVGIIHQFRHGTYLPVQAYVQNFEVTPNFHTFNLRVEKGHYFKKSKFYAGLYLYIENLFNAKNLFYINPSTGDPDDDGYLNSPEAQQEINGQTDPESYRLLYQLFLRNPAYYSNPRIVKFGLNLMF